MSDTTFDDTIARAARDNLNARLAAARLVPPPFDQLTDRQLEVAVLMSIGMTTSEMAFAMGVDAKTIDSHRGRVLDKTGIKATGSASAVRLCRLAIQVGLVSFTSEDDAPTSIEHPAGETAS